MNRVKEYINQALLACGIVFTDQELVYRHAQSVWGNNAMGMGTDLRQAQPEFKDLENQGCSLVIIVINGTEYQCYTRSLADLDKRIEYLLGEVKGFEPTVKQPVQVSAEDEAQRKALEKSEKEWHEARRRWYNKA